MFGSEVLDVVIGILFVYLTLSLISSAVQELIASFLKMRARYLYEGVCTLLDDPDGTGFVRDFYDHPLIATLYSGDYKPGSRGNLPSYIPAQSFALAIMDLAAPPAYPGDLSGASGATAAQEQPGPASFVSNTPQRLRESLARTAGMRPKVSRALLTLVDAAGNDATRTRENIEQWYSNAMDRVSSVYKRSTQTIILVIGILVVAGVNADSISMVRTLSTNKAIRDSLVAASTQIVAARAANNTGAANAGSNPTGNARELNQFESCRTDPNSADCRLELNLNRIRSSGLPFGWVQNAEPGDLRGLPATPWLWFQKVLGILLTVAAISLGAPFWFDVLNKVMVIRSAVKPEPASGTDAAG